MDNRNLKEEATALLGAILSWLVRVLQELAARYVVERLQRKKKPDS